MCALDSYYTKCPHALKTQVLFETFKEAEFKIIKTNKRKRNNKIMCCNSTLEEALEIIKPSNKRNTNKDVKGTMILHTTYHPKDMFLQNIATKFNETCKEKFKEILKTDKCLIAHHNIDNTRKLH